MELGGGKSTVFSVLSDFQWKKNSLKFFYYLNNQHEIQHRSKEEVYILWYPFRRVAGRPKISWGGGKNIFKCIAIFSYILIAQRIRLIHCINTVHLTGFFPKIMWQTNCSNKIVIFWDIATFQQQMLPNFFEIIILSKQKNVKNSNQLFL